MSILKLRFSLRTFLVVIAIGAVAAGWFGYYWHLKSQRQALLAEIQAQGGMYFTYANMPAVQFEYIEALDTIINPPRDLDVFLSEKKEQQISPVLEWFGDSPIRFIRLYEQNLITSKQQQITSLFPEATVKIAPASAKGSRVAELTEAEMEKLRASFQTHKNKATPDAQHEIIQTQPLKFNSPPPSEVPTPYDLKGDR